MTVERVAGNVAYYPALAAEADGIC